MIPGRLKPWKKKHFRKGMTCMTVGCLRVARHQWAFPCAINTAVTPDGGTTWMAVCDECDLELNETLLRVVGVPPHILIDLMSRYKMVQGDGAYS